MKVYPLEDNLPDAEKIRRTSAATSNAFTAKRGLLAGLERIKDQPDEKIPSLLRELLEYARAIPQYEGYSIDDLILVIKREKDFEGRIVPEKSAKPERLPRAKKETRRATKKRPKKRKEHREMPLRDLTDAEVELFYTRFTLNEEHSDFLFRGVRDVDHYIHRERLASAEEGTQTKIVASIEEMGRQRRRNIVDKFKAVWKKRNVEVPPQITAAVDWLSKQPEFAGLTREGFIAALTYNAITLEEALAIGGRVFIKKGRPARTSVPRERRERSERKLFTDHQEAALRLLFAFGPTGTDYAELGALTVGRKIWGERHGVKGSPTLAALQVVDRFVELLGKVDPENPDYTLLPGQARQIVEEVLGRPGCEALTRDDLIAIPQRKIDFDEVIRRGRGLRPGQRNARHGVIFRTPGDDRRFAPRPRQASQPAPLGTKDGSSLRRDGKEGSSSPNRLTLRQAASLAKLLSAPPEMLAPYHLDSLPQDAAQRLMRAAQSDGVPFQFEPHTLGLSAIQLCEIVVRSSDNGGDEARPELTELLEYARSSRDRLSSIVEFARDVEAQFAKRRGSTPVGS